MRLPIAFALLCSATVALAQKSPSPSTRLMDDINWMEFKELVPKHIDTVIVSVGTLEPHGVINNGADNTAPVAIAKSIAGDVNALIAPHVPYGVTGIMAPYPGALNIPEEAFRGYVRAVLDGMAKNGFHKIIIVNGHGGAQTAILESVAREVAFAHDVETMTINWWTLCSDVTLEVFGQDGGHAGNNETAFVQAINPKLVHKELYTGKDMATAYPTGGAWSATPFPSTIGLYKPGQGWPADFSQKTANDYYSKCTNKVSALVKDTIKKWNAAGFR